MGKLEKEVKILDINIKEVQAFLKKINASYKGTKNQKIYTYDIPTIYYRYLECIELLKSDKVLIRSNAISKLIVLFDEFADLVSDQELEEIYNELEINNFEELLNKEDLVSIIEKANKLNFLISKKYINPNKWLRLRQSNDKIELTLKHVFEKNNGSIQKVKEFEVNTSNLEETNLILENMGLVRRNYQEKIRHSYVYKNAEIELDEWPMLKPYMEIECDDENVIQEIIDLLDLNDKEIVSLNTEQLYKRININVLEIADLKF